MRIFERYQNRKDVGAAHDILSSDDDLVAAFAWRASYLTFECLRLRDEEKTSWNDLLVNFYRLSKAHSQYMMVKNFHETLNGEASKAELNSDAHSAMRMLFRLFALNTLELEGAEFFSSAAVTIRQITLTRTVAIPNLLKGIRPHAVRLVDAWDFPDFQLDSSLGRYDGDVYTDMFRRASEENPLNDYVVDPYPDSPVLFKNEKPKL